MSVDNIYPYQQYGNESLKNFRVDYSQYVVYSDNSEVSKSKLKIMVTSEEDKASSRRTGGWCTSFSKDMTTNENCKEHPQKAKETTSGNDIVATYLHGLKAKGMCEGNVISIHQILRKNQLICPTCGIFCLTNNNLNRHRKYHDNEGLFK